MPQLIQVAGGRSIVHELKRRLTTVGRSTKAHLRVRDRAASRLHFHVERTESGFKLKDLASQNGTFVNGVQVHGERPLRVGDRIDAGMSTFFFGKIVRAQGPEGARPAEDRFKTQRFVRPLDRSRRKVEVRRLLKEREQLLKMQRINRDLNSEVDPPALLNGILDAVLELTAAERGFLILAEDDPDGDFEFKAARNIQQEEVAGPEFQISRSIAREVLREGLPVLTQDAEDDERFREIASVRDRGLRSILCLPLTLRGRTLGVVYIDNPYQKGIFTEDDLAMLEGFSDQAAVAIHNARLFDAAVRDALTGLYGHPFFESSVVRALAEEGGPSAVIAADLDRFKIVNDLYGHETGNRILVQAARRIEGALAGRRAVTARFGGDEFEILLPGASRDEARAAADGVRRAVEGAAFEAGDRALHLTLSAGLACFPEDAAQGDALLRRADEALYRAKRSGRNRVAAHGDAADPPGGGITGRAEIDRLAFSRDGLVMMGCIARLLEAGLTADRVADILLGASLEGLEAEDAALVLAPAGPGSVFVRRRGGAAGDADLEERARARLEAAEGGGAAPAPGAPHVLTEVFTARGGWVLGALALGRPADRPFIEEDRELLRLFADKAGRPLENALRFRASQEELDRLNRAWRDGVRRQTEAFSVGGIVGRSRAIREVFEVLEKIRDADLPVLIEGESGTGKELVARAVHFRSPRRDRVFLSENCAAIPDTLLETELFGHLRGAFTGAEQDRKGLFEMADGGTLFLDEVGDMSLSMQARLLRVLQEGEIRPVGATETRRVDVRILAATNRDLEAMVGEGGFRRDLFHRLNVVHLSLPPLRDRREDVELLAEYFLARAVEEGGPADAEKNRGAGRKEFTREALERLALHDWPGNVRELMNEVLRCAVLCPDAEIGPAWLSPAVLGPAAPGAEEGVPLLREAVEDMEKSLIRKAMTLSKGNKTAAARLLGLSWLGLQKKMERYGLL